MSILTRINDIPLFNSSERAIEWGRQFGLRGFHQHSFQGQTGYMAGTSHSQAVQAVSRGPGAAQPRQQQQQRITPNRNTTTPARTTSSGGGY